MDEMTNSKWEMQELTDVEMKNVAGGSFFSRLFTFGCVLLLGAGGTIIGGVPGGLVGGAVGAAVCS